MVRFELWPKYPRFLQLPILPGQPINLIAHSRVVCLMEFACECIQSHPEQLADCIADSGECRAKHLLLTFAINVVVGTFFQGMVAELWNQALRPNVWFQQIQRLSNFRRVDVFLFALQDSSFENSECL